MNYITKQSRSLIILLFVILATVLTAIGLFYILVTISPELKISDFNLNAQTTEANITEPKLLSTAVWDNYRDPTFPLMLKHPETWTINSRTNIPGFYTLAITPEPKKPELLVYISNTSFMALAGLESRDFVTSKNYSGSTFDYLIYAIKSGDYYYTFDGSLNPEYRDEFYTLVNSIEFK